MLALGRPFLYDLPIMTDTDELYLGLDLGTSGLRAIVADGAGEVVATATRPLQSDRHDTVSGAHEQDADEWLTAAYAVVAAVVEAARTARPASRLAALSVDGTSGTIVPVDANLRPLSPALMYDDARPKAVAQQLLAMLADLESRMGYRVSYSFAIPKIVWLLRSGFATESVRWFLGQADYVVAHLTGGVVATDSSNALKTGYDLIDMRWPATLASAGVPLDKLPEVTRSGSVVAPVCPETLRRCGLSAPVSVVAGLTDGTAGLVATGACRVGQMATTVGTTLVLKLVWRDLLKDPAGRIYSHHHPDGHWLPGGASNAGAAVLSRRFGDERLSALLAAAPRQPTRLLAYPLSGRGERFPFKSSEAAHFVSGQPGSDEELYRAYLEAIAYVERLGVEVLEQLGASVGAPVWSAGSAGRIDLLARIRASVLTRPVAVSPQPQSAFGSALLAAAGVRFGSVQAASAKMTRAERVYEPELEWIHPYEDNYQRWKTILTTRGYLSSG